MYFVPNISYNLNSYLLIAFITVVIIQILYLFIFNLRLLFHKSKDTQSNNLPSISVVICARNEEDNLFKNLPKILEQDYPNFEIVVVNDQSADNSKYIILTYQKQHSKIKYIELERNKHRQFGKKLPLTVGIKGAKNQLIVVTDADCQPVSNQWLKSLAKHYGSKKQIVLGYSPHSKAKGFLNKLIRFDTTNIAITYLSHAKIALPYMGVGRNMAYSKQLFEQIGGFKNHYHIASGDDDLFISEAANKKNISIDLEPESYVITTPKNTFKDWINQKQRHFTTAPEYKLINKLFLGISPLTLFLMYILLFILLFNTQWYAFVLTIFGVRMILYWLVNGFILKKLHQKDLILLYPFWEIVYAIVMPFIYYSNRGIEKNKW
jgi:cellulose synthase/poly-beta-1,6-N-acetylglucosamine synthase-like glycosyltransferase